ncbi:prepilin peptidase [Stenotrophomonas sp. 24(2023)]|uniref:A24 family peptidase n=1 Tax=Stenotrophomonas sp. 24(2023) TaxID=3068324 RepID=UPI0027DF05E5|nr:prepilin peptidase [Stenotrophomonas sp. 24(2023)]WMJ69489.1 prepilin peptidase [Stenotrophomonas sp. 24(2023)]
MTLLGLLAIGLCLRIAISDLYARRVPNAWLLGTSALAMVALLAGQFIGPPAAWMPHLLGALLGLVALLPFYAIGWMGAGDVKFFAVIGLLLGMHALLPVWIIASLAAGAHAVAVLACARLPLVLPTPLQLQWERSHRYWRNRPSVQRMQGARQGRQGIPYAAYMGIAAIGWVLWTVHGGSP